MATASIAIITADIVDSRSLDPAEREILYASMKQCMLTLKKEKWIAEFEMFRGDSLQCVVGKNHQSLRIALMIRAFIKSLSPERTDEQTKTSVSKYDIRLSVGIGGVDFYSKKDLAHSDGEAFRLSGDGLDQLKNQIHRLHITTTDRELNDSLYPSLLLLDAILQRWSINGAEAVYYKLKDHKEEKIAGTIGISQSAVSQRLKTSQWYAIDALLNYFEKKIAL